MKRREGKGRKKTHTHTHTRFWATYFNFASHNVAAQEKHMDKEESKSPPPHPQEKKKNRVFRHKLYITTLVPVPTIVMKVHCKKARAAKGTGEK